MPQLKVITDGLNVRRNPSLQGSVISSLEKDDIVEKLDISDDQKWVQIQKGELIGWCRFLDRYIIQYPPDTEESALDRVFQIASSSSAIANWKDRGSAPLGYMKGMALVFARNYCKLLSGEKFALEMAKADTGRIETDALARYRSIFKSAGMDNEASGVETLRHLFVLMLGFGMRESSGRWCEGRDRNANNTTAETAEAGLFQTSWNIRSAHPLLPKLFERYRSDNPPQGFKEIFAEGVAAKSKDLENFGTGNGQDFQQLSKENPAFAVEFAAVGLRHQCLHWGPIKNREAQVRIEADRMFLRVQNLVDTSNICSLLK
jgi:Bacterial SH3 domain